MILALGARGPGFNTRTRHFLLIPVNFAGQPNHPSLYFAEWYRLSLLFFLLLASFITACTVFINMHSNLFHFTLCSKLSILPSSQKHKNCKTTSTNKTSRTPLFTYVNKLRINLAFIYQHKNNKGIQKHRNQKIYFFIKTNINMNKLRNCFVYKIAINALNIHRKSCPKNSNTLNV